MSMSGLLIFSERQVVGRASERSGRVAGADLVGCESDFGQHFVCVLAEQRSWPTSRRGPGMGEPRRHAQIAGLADDRMIHAEDTLTCLQLRVVDKTGSELHPRSCNASLP